MSKLFAGLTRSELMSRIRSQGNKATELALAKLFRRHKVTGWRRQIEIRKAESGKRKFKVRPDFIFPKRKLAVFVDGCSGTAVRSMARSHGTTALSGGGSFHGTKNATHW